MTAISPVPLRHQDVLTEEEAMRSIGNLPKPVLILEAIGILLLALAYLSINDFITLPAVVATPAAAIVMVFTGVALMMPAAVYLVWRVIDGINPLFSAKDRSIDKQRRNLSDSKEKKDDADD